ncbi:hypothetical protein C0V72_03590 [Porphyrobacter sp. TH134]|uniref:DUF4403 family protein n=1 Tax=Porphyrobacter sp. TH134 TaxID=2067450 RepID=UPI000C7B037D|nr:DUF4403 family protein [Porphyrobacter sp. TH134]PLK24838.1 hypothetical protein C0V72_03590 [Porphyrobacter sp. TH134]
MPFLQPIDPLTLDVEAEGEMRVETLRRLTIAGAAVAFMLVAACGSAADPATIAPPRATDRITLPKDPSYIAVDLTVDLAELERALEREVPRELWQIDRPGSECIAPQKVDLALFKVKSPKIECRITGKVTRGKLRLSGKGEALRVTLPVTGTLAARDVAGIFKGETATGAAEVTLGLRLDLTPQWQVTGTTRLDYRWTRAPGIEFMGQRITFTTEADRELAPVKREVQRIIARELARLPVKATAAQGWRQAHAVFALNERDPAVWGRLTPQRFRFGGYGVTGRELTLRLGLDALLDTFVGMKPETSAIGALPPLARRAKTAVASQLHVPVVADYAVLQPVIAKALTKRAQRPFVVKDYGSVTARFDDIAVYGTGEGRIAVGGTFSAKSDLPMIETATGTIWLTARPVNQPGSRAVRFAEVTITGDTDIAGEEFLFALANAPEFQAAITDALAQNFENDFNDLRSKIDKALAARKGRLTDYAITIDKVETGVITAHGEGLYLPVDLTARIAAKLRRVN